MDVADEVATYMAVDRNLFVSLTQIRMERGYGLNALVNEPDANRRQRQLSLGARDGVDQAVDLALGTLRTVTNPNLREKGTELASLVEGWKQLRRAFDTAVDHTLATRDASVRKRLDETGTRLLAKLEAASDATEPAIQKLDPTLGSLIDAPGDDVAGAHERRWRGLHRQPSSSPPIVPPRRRTGLSSTAPTRRAEPPGSWSDA